MVKGELPFLALGLLNKRTSLLSELRNHTVISFMWENFTTVHEPRSIDKVSMNVRRHPDGSARLKAAICFQIVRTAGPPVM